VFDRSWIASASPLLCAAAAITFPAPALAATAPAPSATALGTLSQLQGSGGCLVSRSKPVKGCTPVRALGGPAPFLGSRAIAMSADGRSVYVAASSSNAIAAFRRSVASGRLTQPSGTAGWDADQTAS